MTNISLCRCFESPNAYMDIISVLQKLALFLKLNWNMDTSEKEIIYKFRKQQNVSEFDKEMPQPQTTCQPMAPQRRGTEQ